MTPHAALIWLLTATAIAVPVAIAATSPLLAWRDPIYIVASFSGIVALVLLLVQPLLMGAYLPPLSKPHSRLLHRWVGAGLVLAVVVHVAALWITSPPDVIDALLFAAPAPFSYWGVFALWAVVLSAIVAVRRKRMGARLGLWRLIHTGLAVVIVLGSVVHTMLVVGTMGWWSKAALCLVILGVTAKVIADFRVWAQLARRR